MSYQVNFPSPSTALVNQSGVVTEPWRFFFLQLYQRTGGASGNPSAITSITPTASPFSYTATTRGNVFISGGTVSSVTLTRNGIVISAATSGFIPVSINDIVKITYSGTPTVKFVPS